MNEPPVTAAFEGKTYRLNPLTPLSDSTNHYDLIQRSLEQYARQLTRSPVSVLSILAPPLDSGALLRQ
jgi:hypothetical protein